MGKIKLLVIVVFITVIGLIMASCKSVDDPQPGTLRYETVPFTRNNTANSAGNNVLDKLIYHGYDDEKYFYVFLLGHINYVPITFRNSVIYNGERPVNIEFYSSDATEQSVTKGAENAIEYSTNYTVGIERGIKTNIGFKAGIVEGSLESNVSVSTSESYGVARSTKNTYETMISYVNESRDTFSETIGNYNESAGKYRYALFGTTDVYYVIVTDKSKLNKLDEYLSVCGRSESYTWGIDYDPDIGGNFGKTGGGELLTIPVLALSALPVPTNRIVPGNVPPQTPVAKPSASPTGGTLTNQTTVYLSTATQGADIYYTISDNGSYPPDPTNNSLRYTNLGISLNQKSTNTTYIIKARAYHDYMLESPIMTEVYTMGANVLVTIFRENVGSNGDFRIRYGGERNWLITTSFNIAGLRSAGYKKFVFTLNFDAKNELLINVGSRLYASFWKGLLSNTTSTNLRYNEKFWTPALSRWEAKEFIHEVGLDSFDNQLTIFFGTSANADFTVGSRSITIEAKK